MTMTVNKSQPQSASAGGGWQSGLGTQAPGGDSRREVEAKPMCLARFIRQVPQENVRARNNYFAVRETTAVQPPGVAVESTKRRMEVKISNKTMQLVTSLLEHRHTDRQTDTQPSKSHTT